MIGAWLAGVVAAAELESPPWEREVIGVELLVIQPVLPRLLGFRKSPDVDAPKPIEAAIGHAAIRLVDSGPAARQWTVSVGAYMDLDGDGVDDPSRVGKGLFGGMDNWAGTDFGYDKRLQVLPLEEMAGMYAHEEARWLRRHPMMTTPEEVDALLRVLEQAWATSEAHELGSYGFFAENCSTELAELLNGAWLGRRIELNYPASLPRKYRRYGRSLPDVGTVVPEQATPEAIEGAWAAVPDLYRACADGDTACADAWVAAANAQGPEWTKAARHWTRRRAYREHMDRSQRDALRGR